MSSVTGASVYDVTVSGGNLAGYNGTVGLNLSAGQDIADLQGNALAGTEPGTDQTYTLDNTAVPALYVNQRGECGGKIPCYTSIQAAINAADTGAAISVEQGTYTESIVINTSKSLTLKGVWNSAFSSQTPNTTFIKAPKVQKGSLTLQMLTVKPL